MENTVLALQCMYESTDMSGVCLKITFNTFVEQSLESTGVAGWVEWSIFISHGKQLLKSEDWDNFTRKGASASGSSSSRTMAECDGRVSE